MAHSHCWFVLLYAHCATGFTHMHYSVFFVAALAAVIFQLVILAVLVNPSGFNLWECLGSALLTAISASLVAGIFRPLARKWFPAPDITRVRYS